MGQHVGTGILAITANVQLALWVLDARKTLTTAHQNRAVGGECVLMEWMGTPVYVQQDILEASVRQKSTYAGGTNVRMEAHAMWTDTGIIVCVVLVMRVIGVSMTLTSVMETPV